MYLLIHEDVDTRIIFPDIAIGDSGSSVRVPSKGKFMISLINLIHIILMYLLKKDVDHISFLKLKESLFGMQPIPQGRLRT